MRRLLALLAIALATACLPAADEPAPDAGEGIANACMRSFPPTLEAWQAQFGRVPSECAYLDAWYTVQLVDASEIPAAACEPEPGLVACTSPGERTIYLVRGRDDVALVDSSVHEWVHAIARCVNGDADRGHSRAGLWAPYGESVEVQGQASAVVGTCVQADVVGFVRWALGAVPEEHRPLVQSLMTLLYALGAFLALLRVALNRWLPAGSRARWVVEKFDKLLHYAAANSKPLDARIATRPHPPVDEVTPLPRRVLRK